MIKINGTSYDASAVISRDNSMAITFSNGTVETIADAEALFASNPKIEIFEEEELVGTYYDKAVERVTAAKSGDEDGYFITIVLRVSKIEESAEEALQKEIDSINTTVNSVKESATLTSADIELLSGAIEDLAVLVSEIVEKNANAETVTSEDTSTAADTATASETEEVAND